LIGEQRRINRYLQIWWRCDINNSRCRHYFIEEKIIRKAESVVKVVDFSLVERREILGYNREKSQNIQ